MKAHDKIYICIERTYGASDGQVIAMVTPHNERQSVNDIEYIRKDALLEWLKECKENPVITDLQKGIIQEIIEKIESL